MSEAQTNSDFLDAFFWAMAILFALAAFSDWLLRPKEQEAIKERVNGYWEHLKGKSYPGLVSEDAGWIRRRFIQTFGKSFLSLRGAITVLLISTLMLLPPVFYILHTRPDMKRFSDMSWTFDLAVSISYVVCPAVFMLISIHVTMFFLHRIEESKNFPQILRFIFSDLLMAVILCIASVSVSYFLSQILTDVVLRSLGWTAENSLWGYMENVIVYIVRFFTTFRIDNVVIEAIVVSSSWPSILYVGFIGLFILSKAFEPGLKPFILRVLEALYRSKKGVITIVAGGGAIVAKLAQEGLKHF